MTAINEYKKQWREKKRAEGKCPRCGKPRDTDKVTCSACLAKRSENYKKSIFNKG